MSFSLRQYQIDFINDIRVMMRSHTRVIACAATGSGKSKVFITICKAAISNGSTVLVLSESRKIYRQILNEMPCINIDADNKFSFVKKGALHIAMCQTLQRRKKILELFKYLGNNLLIVADEAHVGTMTKVLQYLDSARIIGFTASPNFRWAKHLPLIYQNIVVGPQPDELVRGYEENGIIKKYLSEYIHWERVVASLGDLKSVGGEFTEASQEEAFEQKVVYDGLFEDLNKFAYKKCIIFTASIHHCMALFERMKAEGYDNIVHVHSASSDAAQSWALKEFMHGQIDICISVGILTKGFDFPAIDLVVLMRATMSEPLYLQMIGRGSRIWPDKSHFTVLDYGGNYTRFGPWDMVRPWRELWNKKRSKSGVPPMRECDNCGYIQHISKTKCDNCGYEFPVQNKPEPPKNTVLIERTGTMNSIIGKRVMELDHKELAIYAKSKNNKMVAVAAAKRREMLQPGFLKAFADEMNYSPTWLFNKLAEVSEGWDSVFEDHVIQ